MLLHVVLRLPATLRRGTNIPAQGRERRDGISCWVAITRPDYARRIVGGGSGPGGLPPSGGSHQGGTACVCTGVGWQRLM